MKRQEELSKVGEAIDTGLYYTVYGTEKGIKATGKGLAIAGRFLAGAARAAYRGGVDAVRDNVETENKDLYIDDFNIETKHLEKNSIGAFSYMNIENTE